MYNEYVQYSCGTEIAQEYCFTWVIDSVLSDHCTHEAYVLLYSVNQKIVVIIIVDLIYGGPMGLIIGIVAALTETQETLGDVN